MFKNVLRVSLPLVTGLMLLAGCDVPVVPGVGTPGPTLTGSVSGVSGSNLRVGLLGAKKAGAQQQELVSTALGGGSYSLKVPNAPTLDLMANDNESILFTLSVYKDNNQNGKFDEGDEVTDASSAKSTLRFFMNDGAPGTYKAGWNVYDPQAGTYSQAFDAAFNLTA